jgi:hypothetical protein
MSSNSRIGLLKFFRDTDKLQKLKDGLFYCNTPEYYRQAGEEGVSDLHESCSHAYRSSRGDEPIKVIFGGYELIDLSALTIHINGIKDRWLHCWFALDLPDTVDDLQSLVNDINRMRKEFGQNFAFLPTQNLPLLVDRLKSISDYEFDHGLVRYSKEKMDWTIGCKSADYSYQREYRFVFGECSHTDVAPLKIENSQGFQDLIWVNGPLQIADQKAGIIWFHLDREQCYCRTSS